MRMLTAQDYQRMLDAVPNLPENAQIYAELTQALAESRVSREPYTFPVNFANLAAAGTANGSFFVDAAAPFMLVEMNYFATPYAVTVMTNATRLIPAINIQITEQSSNRNWQSAAVAVPTIFGSGENPWFLPQPRLIPANTTVSMTVANFDSAQAYNLYLSFIGFRLYS